MEANKERGNLAAGVAFLLVIVVGIVLVMTMGGATEDCGYRDGEKVCWQAPTTAGE